MTPERSDAREPAREEQAREQERHAQAERIDSQQDGAVERLAGAAGQRQDRGQRRPHAGRPADREAGAGDHRADRTGGGASGLQPPFLLQQHPAEAGEHGAHEHDHQAGDDLECSPVLGQQVADGARAGAQRREDRAEAEHEGCGRRRDAACLIGQVVERDARDVREVGGHERPDARRDERDHAGCEGRAEPDGREGDLGEQRHWPRSRVRATRLAAEPRSAGRPAGRRPARGG